MSTSDENTKKDGKKNSTKGLSFQEKLKKLNANKKDLIKTPEKSEKKDIFAESKSPEKIISEEVVSEINNQDNKTEGNEKAKLKIDANFHDQLKNKLKKQGNEEDNDVVNDEPNVNSKEEIIVEKKITPRIIITKPEEDKIVTEETNKDLNIKIESNSNDNNKNTDNKTIDHNTNIKEVITENIQNKAEEPKLENNDEIIKPNELKVELKIEEPLVEKKIDEPNIEIKIDTIIEQPKAKVDEFKAVEEKDQSKVEGNNEVFPLVNVDNRNILIKEESVEPVEPVEIKGNTTNDINKDNDVETVEIKAQPVKIDFENALSINYNQDNKMEENQQPELELGIKTNNQGSGNIKDDQYNIISSKVSNGNINTNINANGNTANINKNDNINNNIDAGNIDLKLTQTQPIINEEKVVINAGITTDISQFQNKESVNINKKVSNAGITETKIQEPNIIKKDINFNTNTNTNNNIAINPTINPRNERNSKEQVEAKQPVQEPVILQSNINNNTNEIMATNENEFWINDDSGMSPLKSPHNFKTNRTDQTQNDEIIIEKNINLPQNLTYDNFTKVYGKTLNPIKDKENNNYIGPIQTEVITDPTAFTQSERELYNQTDPESSPLNNLNTVILPSNKVNYESNINIGRKKKEKGIWSSLDNLNNISTINSGSIIKIYPINKQNAFGTGFGFLRSEADLGIENQNVYKRNPSNNHIKHLFNPEAVERTQKVKVDKVNKLEKIIVEKRDTSQKNRPSKPLTNDVESAILNNKMNYNIEVVQDPRRTEDYFSKVIGGFSKSNHIIKEISDKMLRLEPKRKSEFFFENQKKQKNEMPKNIYEAISNRVNEGGLNYLCKGGFKVKNKNLNAIMYEKMNNTLITANAPNNVKPVYKNNNNTTMGKNEFYFGNLDRLNNSKENLFDKHVVLNTSGVYNSRTNLINLKNNNSKTNIKNTDVNKIRALSPKLSEIDTEDFFDWDYTSK